MTGEGLDIGNDLRSPLAGCGPTDSLVEGYFQTTDRTLVWAHTEKSWRYDPIESCPADRRQKIEENRGDTRHGSDWIVVVGSQAGDSLSRITIDGVPALVSHGRILPGGASSIVLYLRLTELVRASTIGILSQQRFRETRQGFGGGMAYAGNGKHRAVREIRLYTLTEVAESINVSMPTAQRYKKSYQSRIPAVGLGRKQRYPREALKVFEQIKLENLSKRGRPAKELGGRGSLETKQARKRTSSKARQRTKSAQRARTRTRSAARRKAAVRVRPKPSNLLTLTEISQKTGISYPTCINYVKRHLDRIPHVGTGRRRRFPPEAVTVFRELRNQSRSGRRKASATRPNRTDIAVLRRLRDLEKSQKQLARQLDSVLKALNSPLSVTIKRG